MESSSKDPASRHVSVRQLRYFVTVVEHRSFRRAAEKLCISQPPITKQLQGLESTLGVDLLQRQGHKFSLTEAGEAFYAEARMLLAGLDRVCSTIQAFHGAQTRTLALGMADDFVYGPHLDRLLQQAQKLGIGLETTVTLSPSLELQVAHGLVDAALVNLPLSTDSAELVVQPIKSSRLGLVVPKHHPLAGSKQAQLSMLEGLPLVLPPDAPKNAFARQCEQLLMRGGIQPLVAARTTSTALMEVLVERGIGIGIASEYSLRPNNPRLRLIPLTAEGSMYRHAVIHRSDRASKDLTRLLSCLEPEKLPRGGRRR
ncbi:LysR family transcriptional regulator [Steroidobacter flavus]|uniref:LysR family transcriptional regulator n=1 Tax=Steroidobacter flavus TaxID=1842136 RepID=A0ABV8T0E7_9GAMM